MLDSKSSGSDTVRVRPPLPAPKPKKTPHGVSFLVLTGATGRTRCKLRCFLEIYYPPISQLATEPLCRFLRQCARMFDAPLPAPNQKGTPRGAVLVLTEATGRINGAPTIKLGLHYDLRRQYFILFDFESTSQQLKISFYILYPYLFPICDKKC